MSPVSDICDEVPKVQLEIQRRYALLGDIRSTEATPREYISPVLYGVGQLFSGTKLSLVLEQQSSGEIGRGPTDFQFVYKQVPVVVTEAKKDNIPQGIAQNISQLCSAQKVVPCSSV